MISRELQDSLVDCLTDVIRDGIASQAGDFPASSVELKGLDEDGEEVELFFRVRLVVSVSDNSDESSKSVYWDIDNYDIYECGEDGGLK